MSILFIVCLIFSLAPLTGNAAYFEKASENVSAYSASHYKANGSIRKTAHGVTPYNGSAAMKATTVSGSVPFGSQAITPQYITNYNGSSKNTFYIEDTGVSSLLSDYAIDVWWGWCREYAYNNSDLNLGCSKTEPAYVSAKNWGDPLMRLKFFTN